MRCLRANARGLDSDGGAEQASGRWPRARRFNPEYDEAWRVEKRVLQAKPNERSVHQIRAFPAQMITNINWRTTAKPGNVRNAQRPVSIRLNAHSGVTPARSGIYTFVNFCIQECEGDT
ncbi:MAG TPA: hypothetical protein DF282_09060 [Hyphomonas sp.]|nr:hypothetical protein [Hyphomonas sp.]